jgi:Ca2+-binding EF-hand superfamily protein
MNFDAFVKLMGYRSIELDPEEELVAAMSYWDPKGTGLLSEEE